MPLAPSRAVALAVLVLSAAPAAAQPGDPLDLARGLRDNGLADLALEYLDQVAAKKPSPALAAVLPLERALARLDLAADEADDARRDAAIAKARAEFEQFLSAQSNHPRRAEAAVALARVVSAQAKSALTRANKLADDAQRKAERARARPVFEDAAKRFGQAAAAYAGKLDDPDLTPAQKKEVARDVYQAELDRAVNSYLLADTFDAADTKGRAARGEALKQARELFVKLGEKDEAQPLCWVARAWAAECLREMDSAVAARKGFDAVQDAAKKNPAATAGARLARFFEARGDFLTAKDAAALRKAQAALEQWLAEPANRGARPSAEVTAARWYVAVARDQQARALIDPKAKSIPANALGLLKQAERDYKRVMETENDYSSRAAERRTQLLRLLVGDAEKDPAAIATFEEAAMAAQVQLYKALQEAETPEDRAKQMAKAAALYERARALPVPKDGDREATDAGVSLVFAYRLSGRPHQAAVLGEHLAKTARPSDAAARAGLYAVQSYLQAAAGVDPTDAAARAADQDRAAKLTDFLDRQYPADPSTDSARAQLGQLLFRQGKHRQAFDLLAKVSPTSSTAAAARLIQGAAALELIRPTPAGMDAEGGAPPPDAKQKADLYRRAVAALAAVPAPPPDAPADDARLAVLLQVQLAELHLTDAPAGYPKAEKTAEAAVKAAAGFKQLTADDRKELTLKAEHARLRAVYAQALPLYQAGKYAEAAGKVAPILTAAAKDGPAAKDGQPEAVAAAARRVDQFRRDDLLVLAMQARIKEGTGEKVGELFDLMKKLGGSLDAGVGAVAALVAAVRPQAEALRRDGKTAEADKLLRGVGVVLDKVAAEPNLTPRVLVFLGAGLTDMGQPDKAVEVLAKVPAPPAEDLAKKPADLDDKTRPAVQLYRQARLETARALRTGGRFADADKLLAEAMGSKDKPGWAAGDPAFRREVAYVLEDRAAAAPDKKQAAALWGEARTRWAELANEYLPTLRKLGAGRHNARSALLALTDLKAQPPHKLLPPSPEEVKKGLADPKPPAWVRELMTETTPGPDGKPQPNPTAEAYGQSLKQAAARLEAQIKPKYHDLFFESMRCLTRANAHVLKDDPARLKEQLGKIAGEVRKLEAANPDLAPEVRDKFAALMAEYPALKAEYERTKAEPVAVAATTEPKEDAPKAGNGSPAAEPAARPPAASSGPGGSVGLIVGGVAGLVALAGVAAYFVLFRKPAPPPRRSAPAPLFDDTE